MNHAMSHGSSGRPDRRLGTMEDLLLALSSSDGTLRRRARHTLVEIGPPAVPPLIRALWIGDSSLRWEAAKALGVIRDHTAAHALARCLEDEDAGTRWVAAEALIAIGPRAVRALLLALVARADSTWLRQGVHHVLRTLEDRGRLPEIVREVLRSLEKPAAEDASRLAAAQAIRAEEEDPHLRADPATPAQGS